MTLEIVPTREGYERWAPYYDDYDNALIVLEQRVVIVVVVRGPALVALAGRHDLERHGPLLTRARAT
ncbi:MAG TPA: hypothetical protein VM869_21470, partial [Enhygromyxa sp.]|nr:hypothetical protein [Enhygromyxa sp.]